jgi:hypothetical protein
VVCIDVLANITVTHSTGTNAANRVISNEAIVLSGGTLNLGGASQVNNTLTLTGGTLTGVGGMTVTGVFTWTGGDMSGTGQTNANGGMVIGAPYNVLNQRTLNTAGTTTWLGTGDIYLNDGAVINNSGTWDVQNDQNLYANGTFNNLAGAIFRKTAGAGTTTIQVLFNNSGTVETQNGTINFTGGFTGNPPL